MDACRGAPTSKKTAEGGVFAYYRCGGSAAWRHGGEKLCRTRAIGTERLDAAVWDDFRSLLAEPQRLREEYQRRLESPWASPTREASQLTKLIGQARQTIARLIDGYSGDLLEKTEFEPRIKATRERLSQLEREHAERADEEDREAELRLVIGQLEEFANRMSEGLEPADWSTRREIIRALVKKVEVMETEVRVVYRVSPSRFENRPQQDGLQHCWRRRDRHSHNLRENHCPAAVQNRTAEPA